MVVTATELKNNLGRYLEISKSEDVYITRNGKRVAKLTNLSQENQELLDSLGGIFEGYGKPDDWDNPGVARAEMLERKLGNGR